MDRNIPDVRNIFGVGKGSDASSKPKQELRSYEYSPRSRKKFEDYESYENPPSKIPQNTKTYENRSNRRPSRHRSTISDDLIEPPIRPNKKSDEGGKKNSKNDASHYSNRTLTERDIRHLERTLSMKKTIRKQISRNLSQAFVDDPDLIKDNNVSAEKVTNNKVSPDNMFTLTRAKVSKSEQNVLDLLKENEPDSGHCSADNPNSSDDDTQEQVKQRHIANKCLESTRAVPEKSNLPSQNQPAKDDGKFSFWKMFSNKNRGKR